MAVLPVVNVDDVVVGEGDGFATFTLRLSQPSTTVVSVHVRTLAGTATFPYGSASYNDAASISDNVVSFAPGETAKQVNIAITDDTVVETAESFFLNLFTPQGGLVLGQNVAVVTIVDDDTVGPAPQILIDDALANEGDGFARFTLRLNHAAATTVTVTYQTADGSAVAGGDYAALTSSVSFAPGETAKTVTIAINDDTAVEGDETFFLKLTGVMGGEGASLGDLQGTAVIGRSDGPISALPVLNVDDVVAGEGDPVATFILRLSQPSASVVSVRVGTSAGTATFPYGSAPSNDAAGISDDVVNFAPGETVKRVSIPITNDSVVETTESFFLNLSSPQGGLILARNLAVATIVDDDTTGPAPQVLIENTVVNEGDGFARFTLTLNHATSTTVTITYQTVDGSAVAGSDYAAVTSSVSFAPGETAKSVTIAINDDAVLEKDETFFLKLTGVTGGEGAGLGNLQGTAIIGRNDGPTSALPVLDVDDIVVGEGDGVATFTLHLSQPSTSVVSVRVGTSAGTATFPYGSAPSNDGAGISDDIVSFAPGETVKQVSIPITDDRVSPVLVDPAVEPIESFFLNLSSPQGLVLGRNVAVVTIIDNDTVDSAPQVLIDDAAVNEGDGFARFTLTLNHATSTTVTVTYQTADGSAVAGSDYAAVTSSVSFAPGETAKTVTVVISEDTAVEGDETFFLKLTGVTGGEGAGLGNLQGTAIIGRNDGPTSALPVLDVDDVVVGEGDGLATFTLRLSQPSSTIVSVSYGTGNGRAGSGSDFAGSSGTISFAPGETVKSINISLVDDKNTPVLVDPAIEQTESFFLQLSSPQGGLILGRDMAIATILDNDTAGPAPQVLLEDSVVNEGDGLARFTISLNHAATTTVTVSYRTVDGSALAGSDYAAVTSSISFAPGEMAKTVTVSIVEDSLAELDETFFLELTGVTGGEGASLGNTKGTAIIARSDGATAAVPVLNVDDISVGESDGFATFVLRLSQASNSVVSVGFNTANGTAASGSDYTGTSGVIDFAPGETAKEVSIPLVDDHTTPVLVDPAVEPIESFFLFLSSPQGLALGRNAATATILDNDPISAAPQVLVDDVVVNERDGNARFTLKLDHATATTVTVSYQTADGTALAGSDYAAVTSSVVFAPREMAKTVTVAIADDSLDEGDETFFLRLTGVSGGEGAGIGDAQATAVIARNDGATASPPVVNVDDIAVGEGAGLATFVLRLSQPSTDVVSVAYQMVDASAKYTDYVRISGGLVSFAPGETAKQISTAIIDDNVSETTETFLLQLSSPQSLVIGRSSATATIVDNDTTLPGVWISPLSVAQQEADQGTTTFVFSINTAFALNSVQTVSWSIASGNPHPADAQDFVGSVFPSGQVTFAPGETSKIVVANVRGDTLTESDEVFTVNILNVSPGLTTAVGSATGTILNDDVSVSIAALNASLAEGNSGTTAFSFTLTRSGGTPAGQSVSWTVGGFGANPANAQDFAGGFLPAGTVTFAAGEVSKTITVPVSGDTFVEPNEGFTVSLSNPSTGLTIDVGTASGTILTDDVLGSAAVSIAAQNANRTEGDGGTTPFTFTIARTGDLSSTHSVSWAVSGSGVSAANAQDFAGAVLPFGAVTFAVGEASKTITIFIAGDTTVEANETFTVNLLNPSSGLTINGGSAGGVILNDDSVVVAVVAQDDAFIVQQGLSFSAGSSTGVLANDQNASSAALLSGPAHGSLQFSGDGSFNYTPAAGFNGIDAFAYRATGGSTQDDGQALVYVVPVNVGATTTLNLLALTAEQQIAATYGAFFGRAADAGGFDFWVDQFNVGLPTQGPTALFANIASSFGVSNEAKGLYPFLANPFGANGAQIAAFLDSVYNNLFNRSSDTAGLSYWTGQIQQTLASGRFVGSVLVDIMSGSQGSDITILMGKVAVSLAYVHEQKTFHTQWTSADDGAESMALLHAVTAQPQTVLTGIAQAHNLVATDVN